MKEYRFVSLNKQKWERIDKSMDHLARNDVDELTNAYEEVLSDLAYARTQFPQSRIIDYLNDLGLRLHQRIYTPHYFDPKAVVRLITEDVPAIIVRNRKTIGLALFLFVCFVTAGVILAIEDEENIRQTLGDSYVNMTLANIAKGKPTNVYAEMPEDIMFFGILYNNFRVMCAMYASGLIPIVGPLFFMHSNGVMLGEFQTLFFLHDAGLTSMSAIWIHGAFEISGLAIVAGAALILGKGWLLPGSYTRRESAKRAGIESAKLFATTLPMILVAAFLESFVTRHTEFPTGVKLLIIFGSIAIVILYYVVMPLRQYRRSKKGGRA